MKSSLLRSAMAVLVFSLLLFGLTSIAASQVTIRLMDWQLQEPPRDQMLKAQLARFEKEHPGIKVTQEPIATLEHFQKFLLQSQAGVAPDVVRLEDLDLAGYVKPGYLFDLKDFARKEGGGVLNEWHQSLLDAVTWNGKLLFLPDIGMPFVIVANKKLFTEAGIDPAAGPWSTDLFLKYAKALTRTTKGSDRVNQWGYAITAPKGGTTLFLRLAPWIWSFGGDFLTPDGKKSALDRPETIAGFEFFVDLYTKERVAAPGPTQINPYQMRTLMAQEQVAMIMDSGWVIATLEKLNPNLNARTNIFFTPVPVKSVRSPLLHVEGYGISSQTKHAQEAWELVKFLTSEEMMMNQFKSIGMVPARKKPSASSEVLGDKFAKALVDELPLGRTPPHVVQWSEIMEVIGSAAQAGLSGTNTRDALNDAHRRINEILARGN